MFTQELLVNGIAAPSEVPTLRSFLLQSDIKKTIFGYLPQRKKLFKYFQVKLFYTSKLK